ncbi:MAG: hypothetical protein HYT10_02315 [Candidatus Levybacteria bacterium]|nr:hypothetical protein [Candidatus Levybacteria bacterium]
MGNKCFNCGKGIMIGKQHKHHPGVAGGRWKKRAPKTQKIFKPNLHWAKVLVGNNMKRVRLCTKCLRIAKAAQKEKIAPKSELGPVMATAV